MFRVDSANFLHQLVERFIRLFRDDIAFEVIQLHEKASPAMLNSVNSVLVIVNSLKILFQTMTARACHTSRKREQETRTSILEQLKCTLTVSNDYSIVAAEHYAIVHARTEANSTLLT